MKPLETMADKIEMDRNINEALRVLRCCAFQSAPLPNTLELSRGLLTGASKAKNVYTVGDRLVVKYFLAGQQRIFGFFSFSEAPSAYRLADLVIRRFHKLRVRKIPALSEASYNLSLAQVNADSAEESEINSILLQIDALVPDRPAHLRTEKKTVRQEFMKMMSRIDALEMAVESISKKIDELRVSNASVIGELITQIRNHWTKTV